MIPAVKSDLIDHKHFLFVATFEDKPYCHRFQNLITGCKVSFYFGKVTTAAEIEAVAQKIKATAIITTSVELLLKYVAIERARAATLNNYAGSLIPTGVDGIDLLVVNPLKQLQTVSYAPWIMKRFMSKILEPHKWRKISEFKWKWIKTEEDYDDAVRYLSNCFAIAVDIETSPPVIIRSISYTGADVHGGTFTYVFELDTLSAVRWMREINILPVPKIMQNGKYDLAYMFAYRAPVINYIGDTKNAMHSWMVELPKDLAFLTALFIRDVMYWKDLGAAGDKLDQLKYNALDTYGTMEAFLSWLVEAPDWAKRNYITKFRMVPSFHMCEMRGIKRDMKALEMFAEDGEKQLDTILSSLQSMTAQQKFNPSSPKQVTNLLHVLGHSEIENGKRVPPSSSNEKFLDKYRVEHPLSAVIIDKILQYRGIRKLTSTYLTTGEKAKEYKGRILYGLHPDGTDTGRAASKEHHFWCGLQIQNIPAKEDGRAVKQSMVADEGFVFFEADYSNAEGFGVAYCSGDEALLEAVNSVNDFHSWNASKFFGVPYEQIYDNDRRKKLDTALRDLAKRVNHGANYNMGAAVLLVTMGLLNVIKAKELLELPKGWEPLRVCQFLLDRYSQTYPHVKGRYYRWITQQVMNTQKLVGPTGWTRYCFGDPRKNKLDLNSYVAHYTQSLNAMILDEAFFRIFKWQRKENNFKDLQVFAEIHDSVLGQVRIGKENLSQEIKKIMTFSVPIIDCTGIERLMTVPVDVKLTGHRWGGPIKELGETV